MQKWKAQLLVIGLALLVVSGCNEGPARFPVAGKVLIDGQPVSGGSIQFVPEGGRPFASKIGKDGSFRLAELTVSEHAKLPGVLPGKYRVGVSSSEVLDEDEGEMVKHIPGKYADFRTSELEVEIGSAKEDMVIQLTWDGAEESETESAEPPEAEDASTKAESEEGRQS